jgi:hypothetical protein
VRAKLLLDGEGVEILDAFDSVTRPLGGIQMRVLLELMGHEPLNYDDSQVSDPRLRNRPEEPPGPRSPTTGRTRNTWPPGRVSIFSTRTGPGPRW